MEPPRDPILLVLHDGELDDVVGLARELVGDACLERRGGGRREDQAVAWRVVVATARRLVELQKDAGLSLSRAGTCRVAVLDRESRTLRSMLRRAGVELLVRRPVHPAALRLLLLHALYRGPEKRRTQRVSVGAPVRFRSGLRRRDAILADVSLRGCRLITRHPQPRGKRVTVQIPGALGPGRMLALRAEVVRTGVAEDAEPGCETMAVLFERVSRDAQALLRRVLEVHAGGPASLSGAAATAAESVTPARGLPSPEPGGAERRHGPRCVYDQRIVALGDQATRVLIGRDISLGGMRVDPNDGLRPGDRVRLAVHARRREDPLVLDARVLRDDGEEGLVLRFQGLSESASAALRRLLELLPALGSRLVEGHEDAGVIVSEILERSDAGERRASR